MPWASSLVQPWLGHSWQPPRKGLVRKCLNFWMVVKSMLPLIVKTKLPWLHVPELHLPLMMGSGFATAHDMSDLTSQTIMSGRHIHTQCLAEMSSVPLSLSKVTSMRAGGVGVIEYG